MGDQRNELKSPFKNLQYMMDDADENEQPPLIFDNGTGLVKCGFAGEEAPRAVFPCIVGRAKQNAPIMAGMGNARSGTGEHRIFQTEKLEKLLVYVSFKKLSTNFQVYVGDLAQQK